MSLPDDGPAPHYRIDLRFRGRRLLVKLDGTSGPDAERHLAEVRSAAAKCDLDVVVQDDTAEQVPTVAPSLRRAQRDR